MLAAPYIVGKLMMEDIIHEGDTYEVSLAVGRGLDMAFRDYQEHLEEEKAKIELVDVKQSARFTKVSGGHYVMKKERDWILAEIKSDIREGLPYDGAISEKYINKIISNIEVTLDQSIEQCVVDLYRKDEVS